MNTRHVILLLSLALLASLGGVLAWRLVFMSPQPGAEQALVAAPQGAQDLVGSPRPDFTLGRVDGEWVSAADFDGRVVLVNFWATWCKPCREEMPMLVELDHAYAEADFQVVGIALDELQQARDFAAELGVDYPILVGSTDVMAAVRLYGNLSGVLPYSVLIGRDGIIRWAHLGVLEKTELVQRIQELL
ncbi:MAG TPA: TlpA disulfide reductase family protein [Xanthomonadales bacterium]|nr:TlpA disulfide reductase family protein [Xanthomonadales bacterium]